MFFLWRFVICLGCVSYIFPTSKLIDLTRVEIVLDGVSYRCKEAGRKGEVEIFYDLINFPKEALQRIDMEFKDKEGNVLRGKLEQLNYYCKGMVFVEFNGRKNILLEPNQVFKTDKIDKVMLFSSRPDEERQQVKFIVEDSKGKSSAKMCKFEYDFEYYKYKLMLDLSFIKCTLLKCTHPLYYFFNLAFKETMSEKECDVLFIQSYKIGGVKKDFDFNSCPSIFDEVISALRGKKEVAFIFKYRESFTIKVTNENFFVRFFPDLYSFLLDSFFNYISVSIGDFRKACLKSTGFDIYLFDGNDKILSDENKLKEGATYYVKFLYNGEYFDRPVLLPNISFGVDGDVNDNVKVSKNITSLIESDCLDSKYIIPFETKYSGLKKLLEDRNPFLKTMKYELKVGNGYIGDLIAEKGDLYINNDDNIEIVFAAEQSDVIVPYHKGYTKVGLFLPGEVLNLEVPNEISYNGFVDLLRSNLVMKFGAARCAGFDFNNLNLFKDNECITYEDPNAPFFDDDRFISVYLYNFFAPNFNPNKDDKKDVNGGCCCKSGGCCCKSVGGKS